MPTSTSSSLSSTDVISHRPSRLFIILAGFFVANALVAELIGVKIFTLEDSLGLAPWDFNLFGETGSLQFSAGVLLWPVVFVMTDLLNEYYGKRGVRLLSYLTVGLILYAFLMIFIAIQLVPADWWVEQSINHGVPDSQAAFRVTFGQGMFIIVGSVSAFLLAQLTDVFVFRRIRKSTGESRLWLRATGSTLVSQLVDSLVVLGIAFKLGPELFGGIIEPWPWSRLLAVATVQYAFKFTAAILMTPVIYIFHGWIDRYLGHEVATQMKSQREVKRH
ncbi:queuosine precursor transporter [Neolewinella aurantiaca]|uniref:Probable queuosine precursor transporter n=1 Tax=Neolewinella aurantiaca TaxID=2602767 RepID=A0A5C7FG21_9BACT|nr:queuosine precursor transporter [Neolewinella aurantiaca]TXF88627.1 queuosine precursor transporter [Neolewinella aurantiaca]